MRSPTCDGLVESISTAFVDVDIVDASSADDALIALSRSRYDVCFVCLDLPPAPVGGVRLAQAVVRGAGRGSGSDRPQVPVVLVTRSLRWLPATAPELKRLCWVTPDASAPEVAKAVVDAMAQVGIPTAPLSNVRVREDAGPLTEGETETPEPRRKRTSYA